MRRTTPSFVRDLQRSLYFQLTSSPLPASLREDSEVFAALQGAAVDQAVLLLVDDAQCKDRR